MIIGVKHRGLVLRAHASAAGFVDRGPHAHGLVDPVRLIAAVNFSAAQGRGINSGENGESIANAETPFQLSRNIAVPDFDPLYSTSQIEAIERFILTHYSIATPISCSMLTRGMNDVYLIVGSDGERYVFRLSHHRRAAQPM